MQSLAVRPHPHEQLVEFKDNGDGQLLCESKQLHEQVWVFRRKGERQLVPFNGQTHSQVGRSKWKLVEQLVLVKRQTQEHEVVSHEKGAMQVELEDGHKHEQLPESS